VRISYDSRRFRCGSAPRRRCRRGPAPGDIGQALISARRRGRGRSMVRSGPVRDDPMRGMHRRARNRAAAGPSARRPCRCGIAGAEAQLSLCGEQDRSAGASGGPPQGRFRSTRRPGRQSARAVTLSPVWPAAAPPARARILFTGERKPRVESGAGPDHVPRSGPRTESCSLGRESRAPHPRGRP
jgi:hypothetical protein